ncbi:MAG: tRNA 2-thiouridine(34) synthase MnmA [Candidatus Cloacimonetes bacterium]|nr:tRNA 2-thiouridine(34) synthase MnmA [Candidatus Cloacimonadota bacterium]
MTDRIAVAMSGGVDSAIAAYLLMKSYDEVTGVTMQHFDATSSNYPHPESIAEDIRDAARVCAALSLEHRIVDVRIEFRKKIIDYFISEYARGSTPNPCTLCNPVIKWGILWDELQDQGFSRFATGHYVKKQERGRSCYLKRAKDREKDQSYMLWGLTREQVASTIFPNGNYKKAYIRSLARKLDLPVHDKGDSQEICFIKGHYEEFLREHITMQPGDIVDLSGKIIGKHRGLPLYTVGQRKGLHTPWKSALYVMKLDMADNCLVVTDNENDLYDNKFTAGDLNWTSGDPPRPQTGITVQVRYNSNPVAVSKLIFHDSQLEVILDKAVRAITPGQSAVFYDQDRLLGGGIIK